MHPAQHLARVHQDHGLDALVERIEPIHVSLQLAVGEQGLLLCAREEAAAVKVGGAALDERSNVVEVVLEKPQPARVHLVPLGGEGGAVAEKRFKQFDGGNGGIEHLYYIGEFVAL